MHPRLQWLRERADLLPDTDLAGTAARVREGAALTPESVWLLVAAAALASIGLDTDSVAVIIGAMLISPLMSPILGVGFGIATHDRGLLMLSLRELGLATLLSIAISALYFVISPLGEPTSQEAARITPTLLDVGVAVFGGVAGIVAGSRKHPGIAIPGVAIATALMPPLCTAGFGLATLRPAYFFGAFYLFFINAVFIALATYAVTRLLGFPHVAIPDAAAARRTRRLVWGVSLVTLLPSLVILLSVVSEARLQREAERFVGREVRSGSVEVLSWSLDWPEPGPFDLLLWRFAANDRSPLLKVYYAGDPLVGAFSDSLQSRMQAYRLERLDLRLVQAGVSVGQALEFQRITERNASTAINTLRLRQDRIVAWLDSATTGPTVRARAAASAAVAKEELVSAIRVSEPELLVTGEGDRWLHQVSLQLAAGSPPARRAAVENTLAELRRRLAPDSVALLSR